MAFDIKMLKKIADAGHFGLYVYDTADAAATVDTADYFLAAIKFLNIGDIIIRRTGTLDSYGALTAVSSVGLHYVNANNGTTIDVADALALTATDTD